MARKGRGLGGWAFLIGVILAVIFGFLGSLGGTITWVLVVLGILIGLFNIADEETSHFLMSSVVLVIVATFGQSVTQAIPMLGNILTALLILFFPATIIVAIKNVFVMAKR